MAHQQDETTRLQAIPQQLLDRAQLYANTMNVEILTRVSVAVTEQMRRYVQRKLREFAEEAIATIADYVSALEAARQEIAKLESQLSMLLKKRDEVRRTKPTASVETQLEAARQERDDARADVVRMATSLIGAKCEHHKLPFGELESLAIRECPICWKEAAKSAEAQLDALTRAFNCCELHTPDKWEGDGTCVICEGGQLRAQRDALTAALRALHGEIAQHTASFFWNDIDIGLLHAKWRDRLAALLADPGRASAAPQTTE
jgi:hypothetical protein